MRPQKTRLTAVQLAGLQQVWGRQFTRRQWALRLGQIAPRQEAQVWENKEVRVSGALLSIAFFVVAILGIWILTG